MTELFNDNGHLTLDALKALCGESDFDCIERLEISEHLSFCDMCVTRYVELLDGIPQLAPEQPLAPGVVSRLRKKLRSQIFGKYAAVVIAASFTILFWNIGLFDIAAKMDGNQLIGIMSTHASSFSEKSGQAADRLSYALNNFVNSIGFERGLDHGEK